MSIYAGVNPNSTGDLSLVNPATECFLNNKKDATKEQAEQVFYGTLICTSSRRSNQGVKIDSKTSNDMVRKSKVINCQKMYKISVKVIKLITEAMENLKIGKHTETI